jgi:uridine phosphorylase
MDVPKREYPILEFDPSRDAVIEPAKILKRKDIPEHCVLCFFAEVIEKVREERGAKEVASTKSEMGVHPIYEIAREGRRLAFFHPGVGAALAAAMLEEVIAIGCRKFIACGGAGVLDKNVAHGHIVVPTAAVRDEGVSYHYLPPSREVAAPRAGVAAIEKTLKAHGCDYLLAKTWTTDAFYRETPGKVKLRRDEGCLTVEMEAAALFAVAQFRNVIFAQMLYGGDDVSSEEWNRRGWNDPRATVREKLFWLAAEACLSL